MNRYGLKSLEKALSFCINPVHCQSHPMLLPRTNFFHPHEGGIRSYMPAAVPVHTWLPVCEAVPDWDFAFSHFLSSYNRKTDRQKLPVHSQKSYFSASRAALTLSGVAGIAQTLAPVALKIALKIAGCPAVKGPSPQPDAP